MLNDILLEYLDLVLKALILSFSCWMQRDILEIVVFHHVKQRRQLLLNRVSAAIALRRDVDDISERLVVVPINQPVTSSRPSGLLCRYSHR